MSSPSQIGEIKRAGGWRGSPNSIAALLRFSVPIPLLRKCVRCSQLALRGEPYCLKHAGRPLLSAAAGRGERRMLNKLERLGLLPLDLLSLPVWRGLMGLPTSQRAPMRLQLVQAWDKRHLAPMRWAAVQRMAIDLAATPGKRQNTAPWYENT